MFLLVMIVVDMFWEVIIKGKEGWELGRGLIERILIFIKEYIKLRL